MPAGCARRSHARCAPALAARPPPGGRPSRCVHCTSFLASRDRVKGSRGLYQRAAMALRRAAMASVNSGRAPRRSQPPRSSRVPALRPADRARRLATLGEGNLDRVEVARQPPSARTPRAPPFAQLVPRVAAREVRQREHPHLCLARDSRRLRGGAVRGLARRSDSSSANVASCTSRSASCAAIASDSHGAVSPESTTLRPARIGAETCSGVTPSTVSPRCNRPKSGPGLTPSAARARASRCPGRRPRRARTRSRPRPGGGPGSRQSHTRRARTVSVGLRARRRSTRRAAGRRRSASPPSARFSPRGPYTLSGCVAFAQRERLQHPRQSQPVIGVEVRDEHAVHVGQPDRTRRAGAGCPRRSRTGCGRRHGGSGPRAARAAGSAPSHRCRRRTTDRSIACNGSVGGPPTAVSSPAGTPSDRVNQRP